MGGRGSRFQDAGYDVPKPFIKFHGQTMIENVVDNLGVNNDYIFVVQMEHYNHFKYVFDEIEHRVKSLKVRQLETITSGAAESCLKASHFLDLNSPLMIANCDQMMEWKPIEFKAWFLDSGLDGAILTFDSQDPKNSYALLNPDGLVSLTAEKQVISNHATNGIYVWRKARDFTDAAREMIMFDQRVNNEFYVCPCFNRNISWQQKIGIYYIEKHYPIGTPQDLTNYLDITGMKPWK